MCVCINISGTTSMATVPLRPRRRKDIEMKTFWLLAAILAISFAEDIVQDKEDLKEVHNRAEENVELLRTGIEGEALARASSSYPDYSNYLPNFNPTQSNFPNINNFAPQGNYQNAFPGQNFQNFASPGGNQIPFNSQSSYVPSFTTFPSPGNQNSVQNNFNIPSQIPTSQGSFPTPPSFPNQNQINNFIPQGNFITSPQGSSQGSPSTQGSNNYFPSLPQNNYFPSEFNYVQNNLIPQSDVPSTAAPVSNDLPVNQATWPQNGNQQWIQPNPPVNNNLPASQNNWQQQNNNQQWSQPAAPVSNDPPAVQNDWQQNNQQWNKPAVPTTTAAPVGIIKDERVTGDNGYYRYEYQYTDGTHVSEEGFRKVADDPNTTVKRGWYQYRAADGKVYTTTYWADENGYTAYGDHLPKPPPVPAAIQEALDQAAKEEAAKQEAEKNQQAQRPQQGYPAQQPQQGYPAQQPQQSYPAQQTQNNYQQQYGK